MEFRWIQPTDQSWSDYVSAWESDIYHLPSYAVAAEGSRASRIGAALVEHGSQRLLMPLALREIDASFASDRGQLDAMSPYGYSGPILSPEWTADREALLKDAVSVLIDGLSDAGIVAVFVRLHPFIGLKAADVLGTGTIVHHGDTVMIDLTRSEEELWAGTRKGHRYEINRSRKSGHRAFLDAEWRHFDEFLEIYAETMGRVGATDDYSFTRSYFTALREALGEHLHLWVVEVDGQIAAASLFTEYKAIVQYHLSGTRSEFLKIQPNKLLLHEVRLWAKRRGNRVMHLGGGVGGKQDSLFAFKAGFSKQICPFHTWRLVANQDAYDDLVHSRGMDPNMVDPSGFFPAYRRQLA